MNKKVIKTNGKKNTVEFKKKEQPKIAKEDLASNLPVKIDFQVSTLTDNRDPVDVVVGQMAMVQRLYKTVMIENVHYGVIQGTQKPSLLKAGAEKVIQLMKLTPEYIINKEWLPDGHVNFDVRTRLTQMGTGTFFGEGVGSCSTMEKKFRWRDTYTPVKAVPKEYWAKRDPKFLEGMKAKKMADGTWMLCTTDEKKANEDIADLYNTVLKMAKKRSLVDAVLTSSAVSDIFTQDVEDMILGNKDSDTSDLKVGNKMTIDEAIIQMDGCKNMQDLVLAATKIKGVDWTEEEKKLLEKTYAGHPIIVETLKHKAVKIAGEPIDGDKGE